MLNYPAQHIFINKAFLFFDALLKKSRLLNYFNGLSGKIKVFYDKEAFIKELSRVVGGFEESLKKNLNTNETLNIADSILEHRYSLLGFNGVIKNGEWNIDKISGFAWDTGKWYKKYLLSDSNLNADVKFPWELSRCHQLLWLGTAYLLTKDRKYSVEIIETINDWIKCNPYKRSINWTCSMEVAIRCVNWLYAVKMISDSDVLDEHFIKDFQRSIYEHGCYIYNNLEYSPGYNANHYYANILGLIYTGFLFSTHPLPKKWLFFAINEYVHETRIQFLPSGANYENTISYHRLMTEMAVCGFYSILRNGYKLPVDVKYRISKALSFVSAYTVDSYSPLIGDNDDGRFLPIVKRDYRDHKYLIDPRSPESIVWSCQCECDKLFSFIKKQNTFKSESGFAVLKNDRSFIFVANSEPSRYVDYGKRFIPTHTHNDKLSFEFVLDNIPIIIDPGTYVYNSDFAKRNEFRSTLKHNTILVDDEEQNILPANNVFAVEQNVYIEDLDVEEGKNKLYCEGAYSTSEGALYHKRIFCLTNESVEISDNIKKKGENHSCVISFHFNPNLEVLPQNERLIFKSGEKVLATMSITTSNSYDVIIEKDTVSPSYGILKAAKTLRLRLEFRDELNIKYIIKWE